MPVAWNEIEPVLEQWIEDHEAELSDLVQELVSYPSVGTGLQTGAAYPFGVPCARLADESKSIVERYGLSWQNHEYYAISATYGNPVRAIGSGGAETRPRIAFFSHLDVVPAGVSGWTRPPFEPWVQDGWIYGRGSTDNKGPFSSVLFALRFLAEREIELKHDVTLYGGFDEEGGMDDAKWIVRHLEPAHFNLISDCSFPVCVAEKGIFEIELVKQVDDPAILDLYAGEAANAVPDYAYADFVSDASKTERLEVFGKAAHAAFPEGSENALVVLARQLAGSEAFSSKARDGFAAIADIFANFDGAKAGVALHDDFLGDTTCVPTVMRYTEGAIRLLVNLRYPAIDSSKAVLERFVGSLGAHGFEIKSVKESPARPVHEDEQLVDLLTSIVNDELGAHLKPYAMGGATHARWIPGALGFGPERYRDSVLPAGVGSGHEADEAVNIDSLKQAIKVYVRAIIELDRR